MRMCIVRMRRRIISLPLYPGLTSEQQDYVIDTLKSLCEE